MTPARLLATLALLVPLLAMAHDEDPAPSAPPAALNAADTAVAVARAERLGKAMFLQDLAAERATDVLAARHRGFRKDKRIRGWITEEHDGRYRVSYIDATPAVLYRIDMAADGTPAGDAEVLSEPAPLSPYEADAAAARALALTAQVAPCARTYNTVVLPEGDRRWSVYVLPATTLRYVVPLGGSHRVDIADGQITSDRGFTYTCIQLGRARSTPHGEVAAMMVTHLLDPIPTEVHVYWSLWARTPMFVATSSSAVWEIKEGRIRALDETPQAPPTSH